MAEHRRTLELIVATWSRRLRLPTYVKTAEKLDRLVNGAAAAQAIGLIQIPFVMLRFIFGKAAWLTPCDGKYFLNRI